MVLQLVEKKDQIFPLFVMQVFGDVPCVPGNYNLEKTNIPYSYIKIFFEHFERSFRGWRLQRRSLHRQLRTEFPRRRHKPGKPFFKQINQFPTNDQKEIILNIWIFKPGPDRGRVQRPFLGEEGHHRDQGAGGRVRGPVLPRRVPREVPPGSAGGENSVLKIESRFPKKRFFIRRP